MTDRVFEFIIAGLRLEKTCFFDEKAREGDLNAIRGAFIIERTMDIVAYQQDVIQNILITTQHHTEGRIREYIHWMAEDDDSDIVYRSVILVLLDELKPIYKNLSQWVEVEGDIFYLDYLSQCKDKRKTRLQRDCFEGYIYRRQTFFRVAQMDRVIQTIRDIVENNGDIRRIIGLLTYGIDTIHSICLN